VQALIEVCTEHSHEAIVRRLSEIICKVAMGGEASAIAVNDESKESTLESRIDLAAPLRQHGRIDGQVASP
jgi:hypothetical protein